MSTRASVPVYHARSLIEGYKVGHPGKTLVAVPATYLGKRFYIEYEGQDMEINEHPIEYRRFEDKFGRGTTYTLCYYEWKPTQDIHS